MRSVAGCFLIALRRHLIIERRSAQSAASALRHLHLQASHGSKENDENADGDEGERRPREKLGRPVETLATPRSHESDKRQDKPDAVTDQHHGKSRRSRSRRTANPKFPNQQTEPEKKKRREPEFAEMIHAATGYAISPIPANFAPR